VFVGFGIGGRGGEPSKVVMADVELFADVVIHDWIIVASVRYAPIATLPGPTPDGDQYEEAALGNSKPRPRPFTASRSITRELLRQTTPCIWRPSR
jgi:hypothetical protein